MTDTVGFEPLEILQSRNHSDEVCPCLVGMTLYNMLIPEDVGCEESQSHQDERKRPQWRVQSWQGGAEGRDQGVLASGSPVFRCDSCIPPSLYFINKCPSDLISVHSRHNTATTFQQKQFFSELYIVRFLVWLLIAHIQSLPASSNLFTIVKTLYSP